LQRGPDGALWFTEYSRNNIGRITTTGVITEFPMPNVGSEPYGITAGRDGAIWFTAGGSIGRITTAGVITMCPGNCCVGNRIATGPDGALWITELVNNDPYLPPKIVRITTSGSTTGYTPPTGNQGISALAVAPDGTLWFGTGTCEIGSITTGGAMNAYQVPDCGVGEVYAITAGPDAAMWFVGMQGNLGRITTSGAITLYPSGTGVGLGITVGPEGELWFTDGEIAEAFFVTASLSVSPDSGVSQTNRTFTGSGFTPGETVRIYSQGVGSAGLANPASDATGAFTVAAHVPNSPYGARIYVAVGLSSHKLGAASFTVTPALVLNPDYGPRGSTVTVEGSGFPALTGFLIYWSALGTQLGTAHTDANGVFDGSAEVTFTIPDGAALGANRVEAAWNCTGRPPTCPDAGSAYFTVQ